jgi:hypothetical protein
LDGRPIHHIYRATSTLHSRTSLLNPASNTPFIFSFIQLTPHHPTPRPVYPTSQRPRPNPTPTPRRPPRPDAPHRSHNETNHTRIVTLIPPRRIHSLTPHPLTCRHGNESTWPTHVSVHPNTHSNLPWPRDASEAVNSCRSRSRSRSAPDAWGGMGCG